jgi:hypothetical protein
MEKGITSGITNIHVSNKIKVKVPHHLFGGVFLFHSYIVYIIPVHLIIINI